MTSSAPPILLTIRAFRLKNPSTPTMRWKIAATRMNGMPRPRP